MAQADGRAGPRALHRYQAPGTPPSVPAYRGNPGITMNLQIETRVERADQIDALGGGWKTTSLNGPNDSVIQSLRSTIATQ